MKAKTQSSSPRSTVPFPPTATYHEILAARIAALCGVRPAVVPVLLSRAVAAGRFAGSEHPDVRVIRAAYEAAQPARSGSRRDGFFAISDVPVRVMAALRVLDRVPYETLAAVFRTRTPQQISQDIGEALHRAFSISETANSMPRSEFLRAVAAADAQLTAAQYALVRSDETIDDSVWTFYDMLRATAPTLGADLYRTARRHGILSPEILPTQSPQEILPSTDAAQSTTSSDLSDTVSAPIKSGAIKNDSSASSSSDASDTSSASSTSSARRRRSYRGVWRTIVHVTVGTLAALILVGGALYILAQWEAPASPEVTKHQS